MGKELGTSSISRPSELTKFATRFIDEFCNRLAFPSAWDIQVKCHPEDSDQHPPRIRPLRSTLENQKLTVHLSEKALRDISPLALQGWLNMDLARRQIELEPRAYRINFEREIRPLFNISGSGVHMVRHMVAHLENSLKNLIAAQIVIEIGNIRPLLFYYHYKISPSVEEMENYQRLFPHHWIRALFLCKKNKGFLPVALLADTGTAAELESYWWHCHAYMSPQDRRLLKTLYRFSNQNSVKNFSENLVEMFKFVKSQLLI